MAEGSGSHLVEIQPVTKYRQAAYPTHSAMASGELDSRLPRRWAANPKIVAFVAIAGATMQTGWTSVHAVTRGFMPPQYVTESDAASIAKEQAKKAGLAFKLNSKKIAITITTQTGKTQKVDFVLDLYDEKTGVGFECLSNLDCYDVYGYDSKVTPQQLAKTINKSLSKTDRAKIKVIAESDRSDKDVRNKEQQDLKNELRSFFDWLKQQGII